ncbi:MAG: YqeG family HAD IIIA-type phosphatase [Mycoplasma sp.]|nr:YqeG family HAD IIIA-type phosphatase [Mycoplasma sp.]
MRFHYQIILNYLKPSIYVRSFKEVNITSLRDQGIKLLICDLDNTLVPHYTRFPNKDVLNFVKSLKKHNIEIAVVSNNLKSRVKTFCEKANIEVYRGNAKKPFKKAVMQVMSHFKVSSSEVIFMGDQIIMDILVANRIGCESILVQPLISTDYNMSKINIFLETQIYNKLEKNNILKKGNYTDKSIHSSFELL